MNFNSIRSFYKIVLVNSLTANILLVPETMANAAVYGNLTGYYPYGLPWADWQGEDRWLYGGKEFEREHGLFTYDFHARAYDPALCRFTAPDPLAAKYERINPFVYCAANPITLTDPTGCEIVSDENGKYLKNMKDDFVFALGLDRDKQKEFGKMLKIDYYNYKFKHIDEDKYLSMLDDMALSQDQYILARYMLQAINDKDNAFWADYTPDNELLPEKSAEILDTVFKEGCKDSMKVPGTGSYRVETLRSTHGGGFSFYQNNVGFFSTNPSYGKLERSRTTIHEILGHMVSSTLPITISDNKHAILIENCFNRIHTPTQLNDGKTHDFKDGEDAAILPLLFWK